MKHIKKYNESTDDMYLLIDDYFLEYSEKWKLKEESENKENDFDQYPKTGLSNTAEVLSLCVDCEKHFSLKIVIKDCSLLLEGQGK